MTDSMVPVGKGNSICKSCGKIYKGNFYEWTGMITKSKGIICEKCAIRETFGTKYKQNRRYKKWQQKKKK